MYMDGTWKEGRANKYNVYNAAPYHWIIMKGS